LVGRQGLGYRTDQIPGSNPQLAQGNGYLSIVALELLWRGPEAHKGGADAVVGTADVGQCTDYMISKSGSRVGEQLHKRRDRRPGFPADPAEGAGRRFTNKVGHAISQQLDQLRQSGLGTWSYVAQNSCGIPLNKRRSRSRGKLASKSLYKGMAYLNWDGGPFLLTVLS
jgi:hypothetical protein